MSKLQLRPIFTFLGISKYIYCSLDTFNVQVIVLTKVLNVSVHNHLAGAQLAAAAPRCPEWLVSTLK